MNSTKMVLVCLKKRRNNEKKACYSFYIFLYKILNFISFINAHKFSVFGCLVSFYKTNRSLTQPCLTQINTAYEIILGGTVI